MFSHVMIGANDVAASKKFYDAVLGALGHDPGEMDDRGRCFYRTRSGVFAITPPINGEPATHGNGSTIGFLAKTPEMADAWHAAGIENGGVSCEDPPGEREGSGVYLASARSIWQQDLRAARIVFSVTGRYVHPSQVVAISANRPK